MIAGESEYDYEIPKKTQKCHFPAIAWQNMKEKRFFMRKTETFVKNYWKWEKLIESQRFSEKPIPIFIQLVFPMNFSDIMQKLFEFLETIRKKPKTVCFCSKTTKKDMI